MTVRFGLIGAGQMAHIHAVAITEQAPGRARIVAVAGGTRAPALATEFGAEAEPTGEAVLERADIDAVVISTPHTAHLPTSLPRPLPASTSCSRSRWPCPSTNARP